MPRKPTNRTDLVHGTPESLFLEDLNLPEEEPLVLDDHVANVAAAEPVYFGDQPLDLEGQFIPPDAN